MFFCWISLFFLTDLSKWNNVNINDTYNIINECINIINSNDDEMLKIAKNLNCETVKRDEYYASNSAPMSEVYKNMAENFNADIVAYTNVTNPLIKDSTIENMITEYFKNINKFTF